MIINYSYFFLVWVGMTTVVSLSWLMITHLWTVGLVCVSRLPEILLLNLWIIEKFSFFFFIWPSLYTMLQDYIIRRSWDAFQFLIQFTGSWGKYAVLQCNKYSAWSHWYLVRKWSVPVAMEMNGCLQIYKHENMKVNKNLNL